VKWDILNCLSNIRDANSWCKASFPFWKNVFFTYQIKNNWGSQCLFMIFLKELDIKIQQVKQTNYRCSPNNLPRICRYLLDKYLLKRPAILPPVNSRSLEDNINMVHSNGSCWGVAQDDVRCIIFQTMITRFCNWCYIASELNTFVPSSNFNAKFVVLKCQTCIKFWKIEYRLQVWTRHVFIF
jgi:hypothetical protein